ncbi:PilZ domain-containing protein [Acanthopleuribacter pedis]|uniref:PilZ domain-containing protein n=1 Tax=Acanthopleuribacter pedis TaxID=442870 RepID=A0A8J7U1T8_9BACT|nr:PilZ domain-containing protein [Acanthopleuribacter pedis]MBO1317024.1 PilZ domain-containing protein [Acanthopleuribacter pedis]
MMFKKKTKKIAEQALEQVLRVACKRRIPARVVSEHHSFSARFLDVDDINLILDNNLSHLDDVRKMRNQELVLYFPFRATLLKGHFRLVGLTTVKNLRGLKFTRPEYVYVDEKRSVKRTQQIPGGSSFTFNTPDLNLYRGTILNVSPNGFGFLLKENIGDNRYLFQKGSLIQAEAQLGDDFKLSFDAEIRHISADEEQGPYRLGVRIKNLSNEAQEDLNQWVFRQSTAQMEAERAGAIATTKSLLVRNRERIPNSILVIGNKQSDLDFWYGCLSRKYEVLTSDANIANIRTALGTNPSLLLIFLDTENPEKASFTRKFCATVQNRTPILFYGEESETAKQQVLMGNISNRGFVDTSQKRVLNGFRSVDLVMQSLLKK